MAAVVVSPENWTVGSPIYYQLGLENQSYNVYNAGSGYRFNTRANYALTSAGSNAVRFEVRSGDTNWFDVGSGKERSEIGSNEHIDYGVPFHIAYDFKLEKGNKNTAIWMVVGQMHHDFGVDEDAGPPPFAIEMKGERMAATIRYRTPDGMEGVKSIFLDSANIERDKFYDIDVYANFENGENGRLVIVRNGVVLADYSGPLGFAAAGEGSVYWKEGIYRYHAPETIAAVYANLDIMSGDMVQLPPLGAQTYVLKPAPTLALTSVHSVEDGAEAVIGGNTVAHATVQIFDGERLVATVEADDKGLFSAQLIAAEGSHSFTAALKDASGTLSAVSSEVPVEVGTSAEIFARMNYLTAMTGLGGVVLTDSHTFTVGSVAQMKALIATPGKALSLIQDGYNFAFWSGTPIYQTLTYYDAVGVRTEAFSNSLVDGSVNRVDHLIYSASSYITREISDFHITGQSYTRAYRAYAGTTLAVYEKYHDDGTLASANYTAPDGSTKATMYDEWGTILSDTQTRIDGVKEIRYYSGGQLTSEQLVYSDGRIENVSPSLADDSKFYPPAVPLVMVNGDNNYFVTSPGDTLREAEHGGNDTIITTLSSYALRQNFENLTYVGNGSTSLTGNEENNILIGWNGSDILIGGEGDDKLIGGRGADLMIGGQGNDTFVVDAVDDIVMESAGGGIDTIQYSVSGILAGNVENGMLLGTSNIDLSGNALSNFLYGNSGNNILDGGLGADSLVGGIGDDTYIVDGGDDIVAEAVNGGYDTVKSLASIILADNVESGMLLGFGELSLSGNALDNVLVGNDAGNILDGGVGADTLIGGLGDDRYTIDNKGDVVVETNGGGTDTINSWVSFSLSDFVENAFLQGSENLNVTGNALSNWLVGNEGSNVIDGGLGSDTLVGGLGDDFYFIDDGADIVVEFAGEGSDTVYASVSYALGDNIENAQLAAGLGANLTGNSLDNRLLGNSRFNILDGGQGADYLAGGAGDDSYIVDNVGDIVVEQYGQGVDTVYALVSYRLSDDVENGVLWAAGNVDLYGNNQFNVLTGNSGNNVLDGGGGSDTLIGGLGNDLFIIDDAGDVVIEAAGEGRDTIQSFSTFTIADNVEDGVLSGTADVDITGNALANVLYGNAGRNTLNGGSGADVAYGGLGNDTYIVNAAGDQTFETADGGSDQVWSTISWTLSENVEALVLKGSASISGFGNSLDNNLMGNSGSNTLDGAGGADRMEGRAGDDIYIVDNTNDKVIEYASEGTDTVRSSVTWTLGANVENLALSGMVKLNGIGNSLNNVMTGNGGGNSLSGQAGADALDGNLGSDILTGGQGADTFIFSTQLGAANVDRITDFTLGEDIIALTASVFNGLGFGPMTNSVFKDTATGVIDADDRVLYNSATGALSFDSDGSGDAAAVQFAMITSRLHLSETSFLII